MPKIPSRKPATPKAKAKAKQHTALVTFLLDRSQSMSNVFEATVEAFNAYVKGLQEDKGDGFNGLFTFLQFDSMSIDRIYIAEPVKNVVPLDRTNFKPRGMTPLIDACMKTIKAVEEALKARDDQPKVIVCFQTDGQENCSLDYKVADLAKAIKEKTALGWEFVFLGAGVDAYAQAAAYGIASVNTMSYDHLSKGATVAAYSSLTGNTRNFAAGNAGSMAFSSVQRESAGDRFAAKVDLGVSVVAKMDIKKGSSIVDDIDLTNGKKA